MATYGASFLIGLLAGRKIFAKEERVEPTVRYLPLTELTSVDVKEIFIKTLMEMGIAREKAESIYRALMENPLVKQYMELTQRRELAIEMLELSNKALEESRISTATYQQIVHRYMHILAETEIELEKIETRIREELEKIIHQISH